MARGHRASAHQVVRGRSNLRKGGLSRVGSRGGRRKPGMPKSSPITKKPCL